MPRRRCADTLHIFHNLNPRSYFGQVSFQVLPFAVLCTCAISNATKMQFNPPCTALRHSGAHTHKHTNAQSNTNNKNRRLDAMRLNEFKNCASLCSAGREGSSVDCRRASVYEWPNFPWTCKSWLSFKQNSYTFHNRMTNPEQIGVAKR